LIALNKKKNLAAGLSLAFNILVTGLKIAAAVTTGSVSLLSESVHSATDIVASGIAFVSVRAAALPPDEEHPYGHGKIETLAGFGESILLMEIVLYIVFEATDRLIHHTEIQNISVGFWVMVASAMASLVLGNFVRKVGKESESMALQSNGQHLRIDFWTSIAVVTALLTTHFTRWYWLDSAFAFVLAIGIAKSAWSMACTAFEQLIDRSLPENELTAIREILISEPTVLSFHRLRARHSGQLHYIEAHVVVPNDWTVVQSHEVADRLEKKINERLSPAQTVIHVDPYDPQKDNRLR
jgi:cation diffusion facilitator family transporter